MCFKRYFASVLTLSCFFSEGYSAWLNLIRLTKKGDLFWQVIGYCFHGASIGLLAG